jgi:hypothetical protein
MHRLVTMSLALLTVLAPACSAPGGSGNSVESSFRLVGAQAVVPAGAAVPAEQQALATRVLGSRWAELGLYWRISYGEGQLDIMPGTYPTYNSLALPPGLDGFAGLPADRLDAALTRDGSTATLTLHIAAAGDGFTDITAVGTWDIDLAEDFIHDLARGRYARHDGQVERADGSLPVAWTVSGKYNGLPFTARFVQSVYVERIVYLMNI